ncbi:MAG: hypothetical protein HQL08_15520 [Nitrospirae bacterium]|nr:hypothetical protein [Nitrospirota bacterium]
MSAGIGIGIGGLGSMGGSIGGGNISPTGTSMVARDHMDFALAVKHKKRGEGDNSFATQLNVLNNSVKAKKVSGVQSGVTGETGTRINKYV